MNMSLIIISTLTLLLQLLINAPVNQATSNNIIVTAHHQQQQQSSSSSLFDAPSSLPSELVRQQQHSSSNYSRTLNSNERIKQLFAPTNNLVHLKSIVRLSTGPTLAKLYSNQLATSDLINGKPIQQQSDTHQIIEQQQQKKKGLFEKICIGTSNKLFVKSNKTEHYLNLVERYQNCTYVIGNLEITWLNETIDGELRPDMSFLESIREITGHLFIANVNVSKIRMPNLQIIRGRDLFSLKKNCDTTKCDDKNEKDEFAMLLMFNELRSLELPNLREILAGGFASINNRNLCHLTTINWDEILNSSYRTLYIYDGGQPACPACDKSCLGAACWNEGPDMCQKISKTTCAHQCKQDRCYGPEQFECCHPFCAGGCTGPKQTDCLACKHFYDDGECVLECPPMQKYNSNKFLWEPNPKGKYAYGASCVKECPDYLLRDNGACVRTCPANKRNSNGECLSCSGPGPKECPQGDVGTTTNSIGATNMVNVAMDYNRASAVNCTFIEGSMSILETSFAGFDDLYSIGDGKIPCNSPLESSWTPSSSSASSSISSSVIDEIANKSSLSSYSTTISLSNQDVTANSINGSSSQQVDVSTSNNDNPTDPFSNCKAIINSTGQQQQQQQSNNDLSLSPASYGGLGSSANSTPQCIKLDEPCPDGYYQDYIGPAGRPVCRRCHHRCQRCTGMGTHISVCQCNAYVAGEQCEDFCPRDYFPDESSRHCQRCSAECNGCSGPTEADCLTCRVYRVYLNSPPAPPISTDSSTSSSSIVLEQSNNIDQSAAAAAASDSPSSAKAFQQQQQRPFNCTSQCPVDKPYRISDGNLPDLTCSELPDNINGDAALLGSRAPNQTLVVGLGTWFMLLFVIFSGVSFYFWFHRMETEKDKTVKLTMHLSGIDDVEPLNPSNLKPNLAPLRSIKETELRKGKELGSGFGGTVYEGLWYPEGREHKNPRPVAIKVLKDNGHEHMNKKFLDEAYIMASVNHPNLVKLMAVCMTPKHLMLITPLMPLGCLLEHVKEHKNEISSKNMLEWSKQIAKGMAYLEEHRMVHRDLALRNVLLPMCGRAMISDFGLAKFLEIDQSEYHSLGGRLPVKWLAPECIRERRFTHKSDVWAFGVTVWELLTFGKRPFEEYNTWKDMLTAIENGARLKQPPYLTTEVYSIMLSCWFYKPEDRPSFRQLTQDFVKFARDPLRYVAIGAKGIDYDPSSPTSLLVDEKFKSRIKAAFDSSPSKSMSSHHHHHHQHQHHLHQHQKQRNQNHDVLDSDQDEYWADSDLEQSQVSSSSLMAGDEQEISPQPHQLLTATSELTPSTHNRINETIRFGFDFKRHHNHNHHHHHNNNNTRHRHSSMSESATSSSLDILKTPTTPLKRMHFGAPHTEQQLIEEVDYDDIGVFKQGGKKQQQQQQLDGNNNNNFITVHPSTDSWTQRIHGTTTNENLTQSQHKRTTTTEQPTDMDDYLLPSPCTESDMHNFSQLYATTTTGPDDCCFDEVDSSKQQQQQQQDNKQQANNSCGVRSTSLSGQHNQFPSPFNEKQQSLYGSSKGANTMPHHHLHHHLSSSMIGINNYEYFITRASSQYLTSQQQQHYADMDPSSLDVASLANRQLLHSEQHSSTSDENIPHSLV